MTGVPRLSLATLTERRVAPDVRGPVVDPRALAVGIVHLGVGAFHRAHQAVVTEDASGATGDTRWGVLGVTQRSPRVVEQLAPQDGLYSVLTTARDVTSLRVIGSLRGVTFLRADASVLDAVTAPSTHVVSTTVSEKGYRRAPSGDPDLTDPDLAADVAALGRELAVGRPDDAPARTPVGALARGLARRRWAHGDPLTVVCCDNLAGNGRVLERLVTGVVEAAGRRGDAARREADRLRGWLADAVAFPSTMVDRITPRTTDAHRAEAVALLGLRDEGLVVAEPFWQWVLEDRFAGPRPAWERAGATLTDDVAPWERAKLRMLNGTHSLVAYLGALRGVRTIDAAVLDPEVEALARTLVRDEVTPTLTPPDGLDLATYGEQVLERFANPATGHTTLQVAADGSQKVPIRLLGTVADRLAAGVVPVAATRAVAAWLVLVARGRDATGAPVPLDDPLADRLRAAAAGDDAGLVDRVLGVHEVFPEAVREAPEWRAALRRDVADLLREVP